MIDPEAQKKQAEQELQTIEEWSKHPITLEVLQRCKEFEECILKDLLLLPVTSVEHFFVREQSIGQLKGLRQLQGLIEENIEAAKQRIEEL